MGTLTDIDSEGFLSAAFDAFPDMLRWDPLSGDNGPNFFGHAWNTATYVIDHPEFGWLAFGGDLSTTGDTVRVTPLDSFSSCLYLAPLGLWITLDAGRIVGVEFNSSTGVVKIGLAAANENTPVAVLRIEQPAPHSRTGSYHLVESFKSERGAFIVPLSRGTTIVEVDAGPTKK
jgi:hypothetical protein